MRVSVKQTLMHQAGAGVATPGERGAHFVRLWTLKEAYVKAVGRGITAAPGLRGFTVSLQPGGRGGLADTAARSVAAGTVRADGSTDGARAGPAGASQRACVDGRGPGSGAGARLADGQLAASAAGDGRAAVGAASSAHFGVAGAAGAAPGAPPHPGAGVATGCAAAPDGTGLRVGFESALGDARRCAFALLAPSERHVAALCLRRGRAEPAGAGSAGDASDRPPRPTVSWDNGSADCSDPERLPEGRGSGGSGGASADTEPRVLGSWDACSAACNGDGSSLNRPTALHGDGQGSGRGVGAGNSCEAMAGKLVLRAWRTVPLRSEAEVACAVLASTDL